MLTQSYKLKLSHARKLRWLKLKKKYNHTKTKRDKFLIPTAPSFHKWCFIFYIPSFWKVFLIRNIDSKIINVNLYSDVYRFSFTLSNNISKVKFDVNSSCVVAYSTFTYNGNTQYLTKFKEVLYSFTRPFFKKVKFKGKGYYLYKNYRNTITPQFGYAHRIYFYSYFASVKFLSKTSVLIFGLLRKDIYTSAHGIRNMRPINIFTGRGVRFSRQIVYRKVGKVSSYR